ncbi:Long-chain-fatty-acid--CoA ligase 6, partial [Nowakowskiella sp. JEL0078]
RPYQLRVICSTLSNLDRLLKLKPEIKDLKTIILLDTTSIPDDLSAQANEQNVNLFTLVEIEKRGKDSVLPHIPPSPDDLFTICFTSGTTGNPKGAMITHKNMVAVCGAVAACVPPDELFNKNDRHLSFNNGFIFKLPMGHMFERAVFHALSFLGVRIGFYRGSRDVNQLFDDVIVLEPTLFPSVPRLMNRLYDKVQQTLESSGLVARKVFSFAVEQKRKSLRAG